MNVPVAASRRAPSFPAAALRMFDVAVGQLLWSKRTVFMALAAGGPVVLALALRALDLSGMSALRVNGVRVGGPVMFGGIIGTFFGFMLAARPGCYIWIGNGPIRDGRSLHSSRYDFNDEILPLGASYWSTLVESILARG